MENRLFFALSPEPDQRMALHATAKNVLARYPPAGRPTAAENLHLTLLFVGEVSADKEIALRAAAGSVRHAPFRFHLNLASSFKGADAWWLGSRDASLQLAELRRQLKDRLHAQQISSDTKRFTPHVTFLQKAPLVLPPTAIMNVEWHVTDFVLIRSHLSASAPHYEEVARWPLLAPEVPAEQLTLL